jgi:molybdopterin converting factor small subunit
MSTAKPPEGKFTLLYFASAATYTNKASDFLPSPLAPSKLYSLLEEMYPGIKRQVLDSAALTVNLEYVDLDEAPDIQAGDEVAIIPPVSSG